MKRGGKENVSLSLLSPLSLSHPLLLPLRRRQGLSGLHRPQRSGEPVEPLVEPLALRGHRPLHVPPPPAHLAQPKRLAQSRGADGPGQVLLVGEDQHCRVAHERVVDDRPELRACLLYALAVGAVDDVYEAVGVAEVVPPQGAELLLPPDVPDGEEDVFVLDLFDVEA